MIIANVMPNRKSLYIPATVDLRSKGFNYASILSISKEEMRIRFTKEQENNLTNGVMKLYFDEKHKTRKHAIIKHKGLTSLMYEFNHMNKWAMNKVSDCSPLWVEYVLIPKF